MSHKLRQNLHVLYHKCIQNSLKQYRCELYVSRHSGLGADQSTNCWSTSSNIWIKKQIPQFLPSNCLIHILMPMNSKGVYAAGRHWWENWLECSETDLESREVYKYYCHLYRFTEICIPLWNETTWLYGRPHLNVQLPPCKAAIIFYREGGRLIVMADHQFFLVPSLHS